MVNYEKLFSMQEVLDRHIETKHGLSEENLVERKILALLVEIGELANETRCFKFWSLKGPSPDKTILEEYVDGIHFILSLGIEKGYQAAVPNSRTKETERKDLTEQVLEIYEAVHTFRRNETSDAYKYVFTAYLELGRMLGFSADDVEKAYVEKNSVNFDRQKQGY